MNAERLLAHYESIADAPDSIPRLRRFILDLAVRDKLVQDTGRNWTETTIEKCFEPLEDGRTMHQGWSPQCETFPSPNVEIWGVLKTTSIQDGYFRPEQNKQLPEKLEPKPKLEVRVGDILITCAGPRSRCGVACLVRRTRRKLMISGKMYRFRVDERRIDPSYMELFLRSDAAQSAINKMKTGSSESGLNLTHDRFRQLVVRFGSLAEQRRIVAKVDELMDLCDRLDAARGAREETRERLTAASLARLNVPHADTFRDDGRFALDALSALTARPDQIKQLCQTILNLAVRGKLVSQNPNDEPASELLASFAATKSKGRKGRDWSQGLSNRASAFEPPLGWAWTTIDETAYRVTVGYVGPMKDQYVEEGVPFLRSQNVRANKFREEGLIYISPEFHQKIIKSALAPGDVVVVRSGNVGTACVIPTTLKEGNCSDLVVIQKPECVLPEFLCFYLNSFAAAHVEAGSVGVALTHFNTKSVATMPLALPPLAEQHRIVAKVDELMALCNRLEASLATSEGTRRRLLDALLAEALDGGVAPAIKAA
jgi:type I restriction enzyme S subunit